MAAAHYLNPTPENARILFAYRNVRAGQPGVSHIGLGVSALHIVRVLRRHRIRADLIPCLGPHEIVAWLKLHPDVTHVVVEAPWMATSSLLTLCLEYPDVKFTVRCHSQVGFLQVESGAIDLIMEELSLGDHVANFAPSGNSLIYCEWIRRTYRSRCPHLPNLYDHERVEHRTPVTDRREVLNIGAFGAIRLLKNLTTACAAAQIIAQSESSRLRFHISVEREEHGRGVVIALQNMMNRLPWAELVKAPWMSWSDFRRYAAGMDLGMQPSATETFNIVTADLAAEGVPSVVSHAITWPPHHWKADMDDAPGMARVGIALLHDRGAGEDGIDALREYERVSLAEWLAYLSS